MPSSEKKYKKEKKKNDKTKNYTICETINKPKTIEMYIVVNENKLSTIIDTAATYNFIAEHIAEKLKLETVRLKESIIFETASGEKINCEKPTYLNFSLNNNKRHYKTSFLVLYSSSDKIILGMQFLKENDAIINLKDNFQTSIQ
ncbi:hypothetical protein DMUE_0465 [Dictyocoela muelleri]|nr:hypothetical protein DMUE_0465 [Dictyocoela muelleri]